MWNGRRPAATRPAVLRADRFARFLDRADVHASAVVDADIGLGLGQVFRLIERGADLQ
jgi:hypothetical protein